MKLAVNIMLFVFITFLSVPTIVTLIEKETDISAFYSFSEEEIQKQVKEIKAEVKTNYNNELFNSLNNAKTIIVSENRSKHDAISEEIFSPPPELI